MEAMKLLETRRSVRKFQARRVEHSTVERIVAAAAWAPSWKNTQVTRYYLVEKPEDMEFLALECTMSDHNRGILQGAPQAVLVTAKKGRSGMEHDGSPTTNKGTGWTMFDVGAATQTFCLAAHELGVGTVIMGMFYYEKAAEHFRIPEEEEVIALLAMGYPDADPKPPVRKPVEELLTVL